MLEAVVADASPLILLGRIDCLDLLRTIAGEVSVPEEVIIEVDSGGKGDASVNALAKASWIVRLPRAVVSPRVAQWRLGEGESAVLSAALEQQGASAVVDDRQARRCATALGVPYFGTIGVVLRARAAGAIQAARPVLEELVAAGMYVTPEIIEASLRGIEE